MIIASKNRRKGLHFMWSTEEEFVPLNPVGVSMHQVSMFTKKLQSAIGGIWAVRNCNIRSTKLDVDLISHNSESNLTIFTNTTISTTQRSHFFNGWAGFELQEGEGLRWLGVSILRESGQLLEKCPSISLLHVVLAGERAFWKWSTRFAYCSD